MKIWLGLASGAAQPAVVFWLGKRGEIGEKKRQIHSRIRLFK
jgi:hypothetical protein